MNEQTVPLEPRLPGVFVGRTKRAIGRMRGLQLCLLLVCAFIAAAGCEPMPPAAAGIDDAGITDPTAQVVKSAHGVVVSAHPLATEVGARVLAKGGNAMDAAVATGFAVSVVEFTGSGIGGRTSIVIRTPDGEIRGIDGLNTVPEGLQKGGAEGYERAGVPGMLAGLARALSEYGTWPLERVLEPAIRLAEEGFPLRPREAALLEAAAMELAQHPGSRDVFLREDGTPPEAGETFRNPQLAHILRSVAEEGIGVFYEGWIADSIHADMERAGGFITREDLAAYEALPGVVVEGEYRGHRLFSNFRPASGHTMIQALQTMEEFEVPGPDEGAEWTSLVAQAVRLAAEDRRMEVGTEEESAEFLTSREHARDRAADIALPGPAAAPTGVEPAGAPARGEWEEAESTSHLSVADAEGMAVALTQSLGPGLGTRVITPGLGFLYATRLGDEPGSRPISGISPTIVLNGDGALAYVTGAAGGARIVTSIVQILSRLVGHGFPLDDAVAAPRIHPTTWTRGPGVATPRVHPSTKLELSVEMGEENFRAAWAGAAIQWPEGVAERLEELGFEVDRDGSGGFAATHSIAYDPAEGVYMGVADLRRGGGAAAPKR